MNWIPEGAEVLDFWLHESSMNPCMEKKPSGWILTYSFKGINRQGDQERQEELGNIKGDFVRQELVWNSSEDWKTMFDMVEGLLKQCMTECRNQGDCRIRKATLIYDNPFTKESRKEEL